MADEKKGEIIPPSALIKVGGNNFASMTDASQLSSMESAAPPFHRTVLNALKASGKIREDQVITNTIRQSPANRNLLAKKILRYVTGARVRNKQGKKLTIIQASCGHTKKNKIPVHKVANKDGDSWLERENDLELLL
jgi:hypothetical protein